MAISPRLATRTRLNGLICTSPTFEKPPFLTLQIQSEIPLFSIVQTAAGMQTVVRSVLHTYIFTIRYGLTKCKR